MQILGDETSGNCLKVRYTADHLGRAYDWVQVSALDGETRRPEFLAINPMGQIPAIVLDDGRTLAQSNAIIRYLAAGSAMLPDDAFSGAKVDEWLFWEQYSHEPYIAVARFWHFAGLAEQNAARLPAKMEGGYHALDVMEQHLSGREFFVGRRYGIADIALYAYTHVAHEGGFSLDDFPAIRAWLARFAALPGYLPMPHRPE